MYRTAARPAVRRPGRRRAPAISVSRSARDRHGRAASCTSTQSSSPPVSAARGVAYRITTFARRRPRAGSGTRAPATNRRTAGRQDPAPPRCRGSADQTRNGARACSMTARPARSRYCFGTVAPNLRPLPAAGMMSQYCNCAGTQFAAARSTVGDISGSAFGAEGGTTW